MSSLKRPPLAPGQLQPSRTTPNFSTASPSPGPPPLSKSESASPVPSPPRRRTTSAGLPPAPPPPVPAGRPASSSSMPGSAAASASPPPALLNSSAIASPISKPPPSSSVKSPTPRSAPPPAPPTPKRSPTPRAQTPTNLADSYFSSPAGLGDSSVFDASMSQSYFPKQQQQHAPPKVPTSLPPATPESSAASPSPVRIGSSAPPPPPPPAPPRPQQQQQQQQREIPLQKRLGLPEESPRVLQSSKDGSLRRPQHQEQPRLPEEDRVEQLFDADGNKIVNMPLANLQRSQKQQHQHLDDDDDVEDENLLPPPLSTEKEETRRRMDEDDDDTVVGGSSSFTQRELEERQRLQAAHFQEKLAQLEAQEDQRQRYSFSATPHPTPRPPSFFDLQQPEARQEVVRFLSSMDKGSVAQLRTLLDAHESFLNQKQVSAESRAEAAQQKQQQENEKKKQKTEARVVDGGNGEDDDDALIALYPPSGAGTYKVSAVTEDGEKATCVVSGTEPVFLRSPKRRRGDSGGVRCIKTFVSFEPVEDEQQQQQQQQQREPPQPRRYAVIPAGADSGRPRMGMYQRGNSSRSPERGSVEASVYDAQRSDYYPSDSQFHLYGGQHQFGLVSSPESLRAYQRRTGRDFFTPPSSAAQLSSTQTLRMSF